MPGDAQEHSLNARELGKNARELGKSARELGKNVCQSSIFLFADLSKPCHVSTKRHVRQLVHNETFNSLFVETPRKFITAKLSIRKPGSVSPPCKHTKNLMKHLLIGQ
jgi:predicted ATP-grasp superfamily ATP-dependent carboligase